MVKTGICLVGWAVCVLAIGSGIGALGLPPGWTFVLAFFLGGFNGLVWVRGWEKWQRNGV